MHIPKHFSITDKAEIASFIEKNAFGQLVSSHQGRPVASHLPFLFCPVSASLTGHLGRNNTQLEELNKQAVLIILQGTHDYISPSWYASAGVPTWNYQAVHIYGVCQTFVDPTRLKQVVADLTSNYESAFAEPWVPEYKAAMLNAIIGVEINITEIQCQYKLSQNRSKEDRKRVINALKKKGNFALANAMEQQES